MKNKNLLLILLLGIFIVFQGCEKKEINLTEQKKKTNLTEQKILNFKNLINNPNKSISSMEKDSVIWYIEAALNYTYGNIKTSDVVGIDSFFVNIIVEETNQINFDQIIYAYNQFNYNITNLPNGNLMKLADLELKETNDKTGNKSLKLTIIETTPRPLLIDFGPTDYWKAFWGGKCGAYEGQYPDRNARTEIASLANITVIPYNGYYTDIENIYFEPYDSYWDESQEYIFYQTGNNSIAPFEQACLNPDEMNYWLNKTKSLALNYKPVNKSISNYYIDWTGYDNPNSSYGYFHIPIISYGILHNYGEEEL